MSYCRNHWLQTHRTIYILLNQMISYKVEWLQELKFCVLEYSSKITFMEFFRKAHREICTKEKEQFLIKSSEDSGERCKRLSATSCYHTEAWENSVGVPVSIIYFSHGTISLFEIFLSWSQEIQSSLSLV